MVLDHVADARRRCRSSAPRPPAMPTSSATVICTDGDVPPVPDRLEDRVAEPQGEDVLDGLLAEVMVDAIDLALAEDARHLAVQRVALARSWPNGFSITTRLQGLSCWVG